MIPTHAPDASLIDAARAAARNSYSPYSHFPVGAALRSDTGEVIMGCNVENAAFGDTICAERNAVTTMISQGAGAAVDTIAIVGLSAAPCWPCGSCRQVLREFNCRRVLVEGADGATVELEFSDLLPHSFGPGDLDGHHG